MPTTKPSPTTLATIARLYPKPTPRPAPAPAHGEQQQRERAQARTAWLAEHRVTEHAAQIMLLASKGLSAPEIAEVMFLSTDTVKTHLWRTYSRIGARDRAHAVAILTRAHVLPHTPIDAAVWERVSVRELEVLQLIADGHSNVEAAQVLGLSALTVKSHLARTAKKLGVGSRTAMVAAALAAEAIR